MKIVSELSSSTEAFDGVQCLAPDLLVCAEETGAGNLGGLSRIEDPVFTEDHVFTDIFESLVDIVIRHIYAAFIQSVAACFD